VGGNGAAAEEAESELDENRFPENHPLFLDEALVEVDFPKIFFRFFVLWAVAG
jgi:hypothetical protein